MIVSLLCAPLFLIASSLIALLPDSWFTVDSAPTGLFSILNTAFKFFPTDVWILTLGSITFWFAAHLLVSGINFVIGLIPFIHIRMGN